MKNYKAKASLEESHESGRYAPGGRAHPCSKRRPVLAIAVAIGALMAPARAAVPSSGTAFTVSGLGLEMRPIPAGTFLMGSPADEPGRQTQEGPQTQVTISKPFWLGQTDITHGQWKSIMGTDLADQVRKALYDNHIYNLGGGPQTLRDYWGLARGADPTSKLGNTDDNLPMHYVSWDDAMEFCRKLTQQAREAGTLPDGYEYTLPTEAQWEYACRAGTTDATYAGPIQIVGKCNAPVLDEIAWYGGNSSLGYQGKGWDTTKWPEKQYPGGTAGPRDVGLKKPNAWGLYDMSGDVFQWCRDWYGPYPDGNVTDPVGASSGPFRVFRGGCWFNFAANCRSAFRDRYQTGFRSNFLGFRLALSSVR
jgi:sulfatase modifying factor 1